MDKPEDKIQTQYIESRTLDLQITKKKKKIKIFFEKLQSSFLWKKKEKPDTSGLNQRLAAIRAKE